MKYILIFTLGLALGAWAVKLAGDMYWRDSLYSALDNWRDQTVECEIRRKSCVRSLMVCNAGAHMRGGGNVP